MAVHVNIAVFCLVGGVNYVGEAKTQERHLSVKSLYTC